VISPKIGRLIDCALPFTWQKDSLLKFPGLTTCVTCSVVIGEVSSDEESTELPVLVSGMALDWNMLRDRLAMRRTFRWSQGTPCCFGELVLY